MGDGYAIFGIEKKWGRIRMRRLYRSTRNKKVAGIFGGLGEIYSIDPTILRLVYLFIVFVGIFSWVIPAIPFVLAYVAAWIVIPKKNGNSTGNAQPQKSDEGP
jgi:phage shock protein C